ncbi:disulfide bond formation protein B [Candidatus Pelagibacter bacterium nBUS_29]|uniref:disulfide bond formation protein B n=1 Tax=Candidatus Pelagibacter bacterium nBUS_29 TaxID=3374190 RepID=UPI003EB97B75
MLSLIQKNLFKTIFLISLIALISAYFIELVLGHQPCNLCLLERIPYFFSIIIIILNLKFNHFEKFFIFLLIIVFLGATLLSLYHFGIEQGLIQESLVCDLQNASETLSKEEILKQLQQKSVSCKDVTFKIFGLSLTTFNIIISCLITIILIKMYFEYDKNR